MKILTVVRSLNVRGMQRAAQTFSLAYRRWGHDVAVLAYGSGGPRRILLKDSSIPVFAPPDDLEQSIKAVERFRPDVIQIHRSGSFNAIEAAILRRMKRGDAVVLETSSFGRVDYSCDSTLIDVHMPKSLFCLWRWRRWLGGRRAAQVGAMMPNPVDAAAFSRAPRQEALEQRRRRGVPEDAYVCGHVGYKCSPLVVQGFEALATRDDGVWFVVVAPPARMLGWLNDLRPSVRQRVVCVSETDDDVELSRVYSTFDCLLHDSMIGETFGYVLAEALLCGVAVVSLARPYRDNGHLELIGHGDGGIIAGQPRFYIDAVREVRQDEDFRRQVAQRGPERIRSRYDVDHTAALTLRVAELAREHRDPGDRQAALDAEPGLRTRVNDEEIMELMRRTVGGPRLRDLALMRLSTSSIGHRLVRILKHRERAALPIFLSHVRAAA